MKILIVDDNPDNRIIGADIIRISGHEAVTANDGYQALDLIAEQGIQFVLVDWMMPEMDGLELVQRIRGQFSERYIYIIMLTAKGTDEDIAQGLENGADDYVVKPFSTREMRARIKSGARLVEMTSRLSENLEHMEHLATRDHLTHLYNRRHFIALAEQNIHQHPDRVCSLFLLDIDHFKAVNDNHGHLVGDAVLRQLAALCEQQVKGVGVIGRYGGEEFIGVLPGFDLSRAELFAEALRQTIEATTMEHDDGNINITASIGLTVNPPDEKLTLNDLIQRADDALYRAKESGRNRVVVREA